VKEAVFKEATYDDVRKSFEVDESNTVYILFNSILVRAVEKQKSITLAINGRKATMLKLVEAIPLIFFTGLRNVADDGLYLFLCSSSPLLCFYSSSPPLLLFLFVL
jgi:hypothetical protein